MTQRELAARAAREVEMPVETPIKLEIFIDYT